MTFSLTSRLGLPQWGSGFDVPTRNEFNNAFAVLEGEVPILNIGVDASKQPPDATPSKQFYLATDTGILWLMDGSQWRSVGRVVNGPMVVRATDTAANLLELRDTSNNVVLSVDAGTRLHRPGAGDFTQLTPLPNGATLPGGSAALPGYTVGVDGLVVMQGKLALTQQVSFTVPRPADHADHSFPSPATLFGSSGTLLVGAGGTQTISLDGVIYYSE